MQVFPVEWSYARSRCKLPLEGAASQGAEVLRVLQLRSD